MASSRRMNLSRKEFPLSITGIYCPPIFWEYQSKAASILEMDTLSIVCSFLIGSAQLFNLEGDIFMFLFVWIISASLFAIGMYLRFFSFFGEICFSFSTSLDR